MKKKILLITAVVAIFAIAVSGTLAYFTAEDKVTNTFTVGSVLIEIYENNKPTDKDSIAFEKPLTPVVNTANPSEDESYIHKAVKVQSTGENAAYIRTHLAIPTSLNNLLCLDINDAGWTRAFTTTFKDENGMEYTVYTYDYKEAVAPEAFTTDVLKGVYLDKTVDLKDNPATDSADLEFCTPNGDGTYTFTGFTAHNKVTGGYETNTVYVMVASQAIQAQGFQNGATEALNAGFGANTNPWSAA